MSGQKMSGQKVSGSQVERRGKRAPLSPEQVRDELMEGVTIDTLVALGVLTSKGGASPSARRKVKQVKHLLNQLNQALTDIFKRYDNPVIVDMGAGRATVSLALYDRWIRAQGKGRLIAVESRPELVQRVRRATESAYPRFEMLEGAALTCELPERIHLVLGLHACDLATDHALARAVVGKADYIALVPCCQAEVAHSLKHSSHEDALKSLWASPHHRREFGAHLTNVMRTLALRSVGYTVSVTELTGWEHSMKNELILGRRVGRYQSQARTDLINVLSETGLIIHSDASHPLQPLPHSPWLITALDELIARRDQPLASTTEDQNTSSDN